MSLTLGLPLVVLIGIVFLGVLAAMLFLDRSSRRSSQAARLVEYTTAVRSAEFPIESLAARRKRERSSVERLLEFAAFAAPQRLHASTQKDLAKARVRMSPKVFLGIRGVILFGFPLLVGLWLLFVPQKTFFHWGILGVVVLLAPRLPSMWLKRRIKANQRTIELALPYALDLMVACLEGGLSLEATLDKVAGDSATLLSEEIRRSLAEIALGRPSIEALRDLGDRTGAPDLRRLTETVVQAERMGVSIAEAMRTLAEESRTRRRHPAE